VLSHHHPGDTLNGCCLEYARIHGFWAIYRVMCGLSSPLTGSAAAAPRGQQLMVSG